MKLPAGLQGPSPARKKRVGDRSGGAGSLSTSERALRAEGRLPSGRHDLSRQFVVKNQRERIVDATASIVAEKGLAALTIPEIARRANVSHQTFYEMYPTKHDAFLGAQKIGLHQALLVTVQAYDAHKDDWPKAIAAGLRALLDYLASEPAHSHLNLVDTFAASPDAIEIRDTRLRAFAAYLQPGYHHAPKDHPVPGIAPEAIAGGIWQVLNHYIEDERTSEPPRRRAATDLRRRSPRSSGPRTLPSGRAQGARAAVRAPPPVGSRSVQSPGAQSRSGPLGSQSARTSRVILPVARRSSIARNASAACSRGKRSPTTGRTKPASIRPSITAPISRLTSGRLIA